MSVNLSDIVGSKEGRIIIACVVVIGVAVVLTVSMKDTTGDQTPSPNAQTAFEKKNGRPDPSVHRKQANEYIQKLAVDSAGDWDKLSPDDQLYVNNMTSGHGKDYIRSYGKLLAEKSAKQMKK
jgi:hypothetical protein